MNLRSMSFFWLVSHFHADAPPLLNPLKADKYLDLNTYFEKYHKRLYKIQTFPSSKKQ